MLFDKRHKYLSSRAHEVDDKYHFVNEMFEVHKHLFEYPDFIKGTSVRKIEINDDYVIFTINNGNSNIRICCDKRDANALPMMFLNFVSYDENEEMDMILKLIKPGDTVFDIGANIGWYTINILLERKGTVVYSFEPIKSACDCLIKNLKLNNQNTDKVYNTGLSDENKKIKFYFDIECSMASSMSNLRENENTVMEECEVQRMDDFVSSIAPEKLDLIKCDVEGSELMVFRGGTETIKKYKPVVFSEMLRKWSDKFGYHPNDIIDLFQSIDYECYVICDKKIKKFGYVDINTIDKNYLFFHKEKHKEMVGKYLMN